MTDLVVNPAVFADLSENVGEDFAIELVSTFLDEAPRMFSDLENAARQADAEAFRRAAHSLKSNAEIFGADRLTAMAREMEVSGLPDDMSPIANLQTMLLETSDALRKLINE